MFDKMRHSDLKNTFFKKSCGILKIWGLCIWVGVEKSCIWIQFILIDWIAEVWRCQEATLFLSTSFSLLFFQMYHANQGTHFIGNVKAYWVGHTIKFELKWPTVQLVSYVKELKILTFSLPWTTIIDI